MRWALISLAFMFAVKADAQPVCPWITEGTVAAVLGGPVTGSIQVQPGGLGSCLFSIEQNHLKEKLQITVAASPFGACPEGSGRKLQGIGSDTVECRSSAAATGEVVESISSRVRGSYFRVSLTLQATAAMAPPEKQESMVREVAEQVAGALY